jgi:uncharacterized protein YbaA (DUF1428 family)
MAHYVDGFVVPVPLRNLDAYRRMAEQAGKVWMEHGALQYWECIGDDVKPGKVTSFPQSVQLKDDETVVFAWILYNSREHRDSVHAKVMEDPRMKDMTDPKSMPFDPSRRCPRSRRRSSRACADKRRDRRRCPGADETRNPHPARAFLHIA